MWCCYKTKLKMFIMDTDGRLAEHHLLSAEWMYVQCMITSFKVRGMSMARGERVLVTLLSHTSAFVLIQTLTVKALVFVPVQTGLMSVQGRCHHLPDTFM